MTNRKMLEGCATPEGTSRRLGATEAAEGWARELGSTGLTVSALGFGAYRVLDGEEEHAAALTVALRDQGVNLIDTSANYGDGSSERAIGGVLAELVAAGAVTRDEIVVVSKVGYVQGTLLDELKLEEEIAPLTARVARVASDHWHSVSPEMVERGLRATLKRLGLEAVDVMLLHDPEYLIEPGPPDAANAPLFAREEAFYSELAQSFAVLEEAVADGRIGCYGMSSDALVAGALSHHQLSLERVLEAAESAGGSEHHLRVIQVPLNCIERKATSASKVEPSLFERCRAAGLAVLANRPLNAAVSGHTVRLADPGPTEHAERFAPARAALAKLEAAIGAHEPTHPLPPWSRELPAAMRKLFGTVAFDDFQLNYADRKTEAALAELARQVKDDPQASGLMERWLRDYLKVYAQLMRSARAQFAVRDHRRLAPRVEEMRAALPEHLHAATPSQTAIAWSATRTGVTCTLVGMRRPDYVADATALKGLNLSVSGQRPAE